MDKSNDIQFQLDRLNDCWNALPDDEYIDLFIDQTDLWCAISNLIRSHKSLTGKP